MLSQFGGKQLVASFSFRVYKIKYTNFQKKNKRKYIKDNKGLPTIFR